MYFTLQFTVLLEEEDGNIFEHQGTVLYCVCVLLCSTCGVEVPLLELLCVYLKSEGVEIGCFELHT